MSVKTRKRLNLPHRETKEDVTLPLEINWTQKIQEMEEELKKHKDAIRFLLSNSKQFQNEIQKEKIKKE